MGVRSRLETGVELQVNSIIFILKLWFETPKTKKFFDKRHQIELECYPLLYLVGENVFFIQDTMMMGADYYQTEAEIASQLAEGKVPIGVGRNTKIRLDIWTKPLFTRITPLPHAQTMHTSSLNRNWEHIGGSWSEYDKKQCLFFSALRSGNSMVNCACRWWFYHFMNKTLIGNSCLQILPICLIADKPMSILLKELHNRQECQDRKRCHHCK